ncbi:MAG: hypothetical protein IH627_15920 [Rubrivivax sp.]|nr:hypothetical protein [Rubrivivax sp.]
MQRPQLEHLIRAAAEITNQHEFVVVGSQSILGTLESPPGRGAAPAAAPAAAVAKPLRIKTLTLTDFRAFPGPAPQAIEFGGKNLLVFGREDWAKLDPARKLRFEPSVCGCSEMSC